MRNHDRPSLSTRPEVAAPHELAGQIEHWYGELTKHFARDDQSAFQDIATTVDNGPGTPRDRYVALLSRMGMHEAAADTSFRIGEGIALDRSLALTHIEILVNGEDSEDYHDLMQADNVETCRQVLTDMLLTRTRAPGAMPALTSQLQAKYFLDLSRREIRRMEREAPTERAKLIEILKQAQNVVSTSQVFKPIKEAWVAGKVAAIGVEDEITGEIVVVHYDKDPEEEVQPSGPAAIEARPTPLSTIRTLAKRVLDGKVVPPEGESFEKTVEAPSTDFEIWVRELLQLQKPDELREALRVAPYEHIDLYRALDNLRQSKGNLSELQFTKNFPQAAEARNLLLVWLRIERLVQAPEGITKKQVQSEIRNMVHGDYTRTGLGPVATPRQLHYFTQEATLRKQNLGQLGLSRQEQRHQNKVLNEAIKEARVYYSLRRN